MEKKSNVHVSTKIIKYKWRYIYTFNSKIEFNVYILFNV
jgi:hypothetical protein